MGKYKEKPMYNVLSIRISDDEKAALRAMTRRTRKSTATLVREALAAYTTPAELSANRG